MDSYGHFLDFDLSSFGHGLLDASATGGSAAEPAPGAFGVALEGYDPLREGLEQPPSVDRDNDFEGLDIGALQLSETSCIPEERSPGLHGFTAGWDEFLTLCGIDPALDLSSPWPPTPTEPTPSPLNDGLKAEEQEDVYPDLSPLHDSYALAQAQSNDVQYMGTYSSGHHTEPSHISFPPHLCVSTTELAALSLPQSVPEDRSHDTSAQLPPGLHEQLPVLLPSHAGQTDYYRQTPARDLSPLSNGESSLFSTPQPSTRATSVSSPDERRDYSRPSPGCSEATTVSYEGHTNEKPTCFLQMPIARQQVPWNVVPARVTELQQREQMLALQKCPRRGGRAQESLRNEDEVTLIREYYPSEVVETAVGRACLWNGGCEHEIIAWEPELRSRLSDHISEHVQQDHLTTYRSALAKQCVPAQDIEASLRVEMERFSAVIKTSSAESTVVCRLPAVGGAPGRTCGTEFKGINVLTRHIETAHWKVPHFCCVCGQQLSREHKRHLRSGNCTLSDERWAEAVETAARCKAQDGATGQKRKRAGKSRGSGDRTAKAFKRS